jgi:predicted anti-sigma-YlaC factor YlaD
MLCERTREWATLRLDGEISEFETAIMQSHLERCPACSGFAEDVAAITAGVRSTPLEPLTHPVEVGSPRRLRLPLRHVQVAAAAALVVLATGLGSVYGALHRTEHPGPSTTPHRAPVGMADESLFLRKLRVADLRPDGPPPIGVTKPPLEVSI